MAPAHRYLIEFHASAFGVRTFFVEDTTNPRELGSKGLQVLTNPDINRAHKFGSIVGAQAQADRYIEIGWDARVVNTDGFVITQYRHHGPAPAPADTTEWQAGIEYCARCGRSLNADCKCKPIEPAPPVVVPPPAPAPKIRLRAADAPRR